MRGGASGQGSSKHGEDGGAGGSQGKNPKFNRLRLTDAQKAILEAAFAMGAFPPRELRIELSQKTNMTMEQISTWFQNRRMRLKKPDPSAAQHGGASQTMRSTTVVGGIVPLTTRNHTSGPSPPSGVNSNHQALTNTNSSIKQGLMVPNLNQGANNHTSPHHNENHHGGTVVAFPSSGAGAGTFRHTQAISDMAMRSGEECKDGRSGGEVVGSPALCSTPNSNPTSTGSGLGAGGVSGNNSGGVRGGGGGGNVGGVGAGGIHSLSSERLNPLLRVHKTAIGQPATSPVPLWIPTLAQAQAAAAAAATAAAAEEAEILTSATAAAVSAAAQAGSNVLRHVPSADNTSTAPEGCLASTLVPPAPPPPPAGDSNNVGTRQPPRLPLFSASSLSMSAVVGPIGTPSLSMITSTITTTTLPASSSSSCSASYSISLATSSATAAMVAPLTRTTPVVGGSSERQNVSGPASPSLPRAALVDPSAAALPPAGPQSSLPPTTIASSAKERTSPRHRLLLGSGSGSSLVLSPRLAESAATPVESAATPVEQQRAPDVTPSELNGPMETPDLVPRDESHVGSLGTTGYDKAEGPSPAAGESREQEAVYFSCSAATPAPAAAESKKSIAEGAVGPGSVGSSSPVRMGRPPRISLGLSSVSAAIAPLPPVYSDSACSLPPEVPSLLVHVSTNVHRTLLSRGSALAAQPAATSKDIAAAHAGACAPSSPSVHTSVPAASTSPQAVQIPAASPRSSPTTTVQPLLPSSFATPPISSLAHLDETRHADAASPPPAVETLSAVGKSPPCVVSKSAVQRDGPPPLLVVSPTAPPPPPPPVLATRGLISSLSSDVPAPISPAQENDRKSPQTIVRSPLGHQAMIPVPVSVEGDGARDRQGREKEMDMAVEVTVPHEELPAAATAGRKAGEEYGCGERARGEVSPSHQAASSPSVKPASSPRPNHPVPSAGSPILDRKQEEDGNEEVLPVFRGGNNEAVNVKDRSDGDAFVGVSGSGEHVVKGGRAPAGGEGGGGEAKRVEGDTKGGGYFDLTMTDGGATQQEVKEVAALASLMQREVGKAEQEWGGIRQWCGEGGQQGREEKEEGELDDDEEEEEEERRRLMHDSLRSPEGESNTLLASKDEELGGEGTEGEEQLQLELGKPELSSDGDQEGHRRRLDRDQGEHRQRIEFSLRANSE
ncbi:hypothetical protein CBR_g20252 [Chara braunii]|uniref:Homeobox domain-containing protein n=1 Tax=Chara braunii TaxID=69332 RepID=A0A388L056_CHABU|nr:hypothetical protein CBR_g20252 [Chara braunii]|eukprot:GBG75622.1 hypothetical protein CBR_g20252 [Chara braunii]